MDLTPPVAPHNLIVTSPYNVSKIDIRWDNPTILPQNSGLNIIGVNVYRSTDNPIGPYVKLNDAPVTVLFFRDETQEAQVMMENATPTLKFKLEPDARWLIYSKNKPIIMPGTNGQATLRVQDVLVEIDNGDGVFITVPAFSIDGITGEIQLISQPVFNYETQQILPPRLPVPPNGRVRISYTYIKNKVLTLLNQRLYYKVATVAIDPNDPTKTIETPLNEISERNPFDIEEIDWVWREAVLRNRWILEQAGERVKVFIRKTMGQTAPSHQTIHGQSYNDDPISLGTNIIGGYDGPYEIIIAPPETEKMIELADMGLHIRYDWETWTGPFPLLNTRDVIVRQNNERYAIGPVNPQGQRGAIFQQHFTMSLIEQGDIRQQIPITGGETQVPPAFDPFRQKPPTEASPAVNNKPQIPPERIIRGKTVTFENISF
jgi:hypothetical protein